MDMWTPPDADFPALTADRYVKTSEPSDAYNCVAWALSRDDTWIGPAEYGYDWPLESPALTVENFIAFFKHHGFSIASAEPLESGTEKIVIYAANAYVHARRGSWQTESGPAKWAKKWTANMTCSRWQGRFTALSIRTWNARSGNDWTGRTNDEIERAAARSRNGSAP
jgi:hypothetical protein